jgi:signal recognition particle receptor subunit beta
MGSRRSIEYPSILEMLLCEHTGMFSISAMNRTTSPPESASLPLGANKQAIIYVIDSSDASRLPTSRSELLTMLSEDELKSVPVLVFANKQDVEGALSPGDISDKLGLAGQEKGREWSVRGSCATKGEGLEEGLDW